MEKPLVNVMYNGEVGAKHQILTYKILRKKTDFVQLITSLSNGNDRPL